jgi:hypothetical protein
LYIYICICVCIEIYINIHTLSNTDEEISEESFYEKIQEMSDRNEATSVVLPEDDVIWQSLASQFDNQGMCIYTYIRTYVNMHIWTYIIVIEDDIYGTQYHLNSREKVITREYVDVEKSLDT